ncbi:MAG: pyridoxamine 5'-phosphate oxidase family protein [Streptosporangiales bacterium]|nr:pyridoxamine 5'-phosphate oxidase family protein [Streptosporangiales bacterium]
MRETADDIDELQRLLDDSIGRSGDHLRSIVTPGERTLTARQLVAALPGMKVLVVATTTARGEPRTSAVDGHFLRGHWVFSTSGTAHKAHHLRARPAVSVAHVDGERIGVFAHGTADDITPEHADHGWIDEHLTEHYGSSPTTWADDIAYFRMRTHWMIGYAFNAAEFPG